MTLAAADLGQLGETPITIMSNTSPNTYLRMDATGVTASSGPGGTVNCEYGIDPNAQFKVRPQQYGTYAFESAASPGVFLRMDATTCPAASMSGGGTVNGRCVIGAEGQYTAHSNGDGSFSFESFAYPGYYLRMDATGVSAAASPGGTVNCRYNASGGAHESFFLSKVVQLLAFNIQRQTQQMWCWDATAVSIANYYNANSGWTQCTLANTVLARNDCCNLDANGVSPGGNWGSWPDNSPLVPNPTNAPGPLQAVGHYTQTLAFALSTAQLGTQIANSAPVVCNISWAGGGGHIVALRGCSQVSGVDHVSVSDPADGSNSDWVYNTFKTAYLGTGTWDHSYPTK
jgi:hypothetical protein